MTVADNTTGGAISDVALYRRLLRYTFPYKGIFALAISGMAILAGTSGWFAAIMEPLVDEGMIARNPEMLEHIPLMIVGIFVVRALGNFMAQYGAAMVGRGVIFDLRQQMFARMMDLPSAYYDAHPSGGLLAKLIFDVEQVASSVTEAVTTLFRDGLTVLVMVGILFHHNWKLTLIFLVVTPLSTVLLRAMGRRFRKASGNIQSSIGEISQVTQEATEGQRVVKAFLAQQAEVSVFRRANERNRKQSLKKGATSAAGISLLQLLASIALAVIIYVAQKELTPGAFVSYMIATVWMMGPSKNLSKVNELIQTGLAAAQSVFEIIDAPAEAETGSKCVERVRGRVEFRHVSFQYATADAPALHEVSFIAEPGQTIALVGASGSGKTTVASLLPRFYRPTAGEIRIDDIPIDEFALANLRSHIAIVGQEAILFDDTIRNNIAYGQQTPIDEHRLEEAARSAYVLEFARHLPDGLGTRVGERGSRLSGGQRQRVAIARALYKDAPILILDEATSALDTESERYVQEAMQRLRANRTTIVIAHRLSTVERADRIIVLSRGRIVEAGKHQELLAHDRVYATLYRKQFAEVAS